MGHPGALVTFPWRNSTFSRFQVFQMNYQIFTMKKGWNISEACTLVLIDKRKLLIRLCPAAIFARSLSGIELEAVGFQVEPYRWRPCGVTWDSSLTVVVIKLRRTSAPLPSNPLHNMLAPLAKATRRRTRIALRPQVQTPSPMPCNVNQCPMGIQAVCNCIMQAAK